MPKQTFTLWNEQKVTALDAGIDADGTFHLLTSGEINNAQSALRSLHLVLRYDAVAPEKPEVVGDPAQTFDISAVVEGKSEDGNQWYPLAYQFSPFRNAEQGAERIIQVQPNLIVIDLGVDDIVYLNDATRARISRQQGAVPDTAFRVCITVTERGFGGPGAFQEVTLTGFGELFDV